MKHRYYITDLFLGAVRGTNDEATAKHYAESEDFYVVEAETGTWLLADGTTEAVAPVPPITEET